MTTRVLASALAAAFFGMSTTMAHAHQTMSTRADSHAPIGVMGDHRHKTGEWMMSYRYMHMDMQGNRSGTQGLTPDQIATSEPNIFFGNPMMPPTLRVVPTKMTMDMHMFGVMYAPSDAVTLMAMGMYVDKKMDHITYMGGMGTAQLGTFSTRAKGLGDTTVSALIGVYDDHNISAHVTAGISIPTGSTSKNDVVLTPMGMMPTLRMPYAMQLGSGTWDMKPALTVVGQQERWSWGAQVSAVIRLHKHNDYRLGNSAAATTWAAYSVAPWISTSVRLTAESKGDISGMDPQIMAPVQTADPENYGGQIVDAGFGVNLLGQSGAVTGHRLAVEFSLPLVRDLDGPQMETDWMLTVGWQKAF